MIFCLAIVAALFPLNATALMDDAQARADVGILLSEGESAANVIAALQADGRELLDACVIATIAAAEEFQFDFIQTCLSSATTVEQARAIADALVAASGQNTQLASTVAQVMDTLTTQTLPPPSSYQGDGIATGGVSVSPST